MSAEFSAEADDSILAIVTVTYEPDLIILARQMQALPVQCLKVIVDNGSRDDAVTALRLLTARCGAELLLNAENRGLAAALNQGAQWVNQRGRDVQFLLFLDQDSEPEPGSIRHLTDAFARLRQDGGRVGCVGPRIMDASTGLQHGFHQMKGWRWTRLFPPGGDSPPVACANLNGSGMLVDRALFEALGGFEESFFIDHVDTEFSFRLSDRGYALMGVPNAYFLHRMGDAGMRFWFFGWRVWPIRSPLRHYYLFRNAVRLMGRPYVPWVWKVWALPKLVLTALVQCTLDPRRADQWTQMRRGIREGRRAT